MITDSWRFSHQIQTHVTSRSASSTATEVSSVQLHYGLRDRTHRIGSHLGVCIITLNAKIMNVFSFWNKRKELTGEWRKTHDEELHNSYSSPSVIRMIKSRSAGMATLVARMGEKQDGVLAVEELKERDHVEDLDVHGRKTVNRC